MVLAVHEIEVALITSAATVLVAGLGIIGIMVQQRRTGQKVDRNANAISEVLDHVNRTEEQMIDGIPVKQTMREEMRAGFVRNDEAHKILNNEVVEMKKTLGKHDKRITNVEKEVGFDG